MIKKLKSVLPPKWKLAALLSISFASSFMLFIYTPFDLYLNNPGDFVISWRFMLLPLLAVFLLCFLALLFVLLLLWNKKIVTGIILLSLCAVLFIVAGLALLVYLLIAVAIAMAVWVLLIKFLKEEAADVIMLLIWGVLAAAYVQTLFLNSGMEVMMGQHTDYTALSAANILNLLIWAAIILIPLCIYIIFKLKKRAFKYEKAFIFSLVIISGMQVAGLVSTAASTNIPEGYDRDPVYFSYESVVSFSTEKNIFVFVLDAFDVILMRQTLELYPHLQDYLDGFTFYENNTSEYFDTTASVTSMLTQHHILPRESGWTYIERAWDRRVYIDTLVENGFDVNLFIDRRNFSKNELLKNRVKNTRYVDEIGINLRPLLYITTRLSLGRISPYLFKNAMLSSIGPEFGRTFFYVEIYDEAASFIPVVNFSSDMRFFHFILQADFSADNEDKVFTFMHLNSAHSSGDRNEPASPGYHINDNGDIQWGGNQTDIIRANFEKFNFFFGKMKELGVYDNSTIIILGDHGFRETIPETVSLLIKPENSNAIFSVDTAAELSALYLPSSILNAAGVDYEETGGISYFDIIGGFKPAPPKRIVFVKGLNSTTPNGRIYGDYGVWEVIEDANKRENWTFVPMDPMDFFPDE